MALLPFARHAEGNGRQRVRAIQPTVHQPAEQKLVDYGLLEHLGNGCYIITETAQQYLSGELDAADLEPDEE